MLLLLVLSSTSVLWGATSTDYETNVTSKALEWTSHYVSVLAFSKSILVEEPGPMPPVSSGLGLTSQSRHNCSLANNQRKLIGNRSIWSFFKFAIIAFFIWWPDESCDVTAQKGSGWLVKEAMTGLAGITGTKMNAGELRAMRKGIEAEHLQLTDGRLTWRLVI